MEYVTLELHTWEVSKTPTQEAPMTTTARQPRNWTYLAVTAIVRLYMLGALAISFSHIIEAAHSTGLQGWQAFTTPFAIDGFAILGMIGRSHRFAASTQRIGFRLQMGAGALSLICNIYAGHNLGERIYGALIVAGFVTAEWYAAKLAPAAVITAPTAAEQLAAKRSAAAVQAAATRKANKVAAERTAKREARELARVTKRVLAEQPA